MTADIATLESEAYKKLKEKTDNIKLSAVIGKYSSLKGLLTTGAAPNPPADWPTYKQQVEKYKEYFIDTVFGAMNKFPSDGQPTYSFTAFDSELQKAVKVVTDVY